MRHLILVIVFFLLIGLYNEKQTSHNRDTRFVIWCIQKCRTNQIEFIAWAKKIDVNDPHSEWTKRLIKLMFAGSVITEQLELIERVYFLRERFFSRRKNLWGLVFFRAGLLMILCFLFRYSLNSNAAFLYNNLNPADLFAGVIMSFFLCALSQYLPSWNHKTYRRDFFIWLQQALALKPLPNLPDLCKLQRIYNSELSTGLPQKQLKMIQIQQWAEKYIKQKENSLARWESLVPLMEFAIGSICMAIQLADPLGKAFSHNL